MHSVTIAFFDNVIYIDNLQVRKNLCNFLSRTISTPTITDAVHFFHLNQTVNKITKANLKQYLQALVKDSHELSALVLVLIVAIIPFDWKPIITHVKFCIARMSLWLLLKWMKTRFVTSYICNWFGCFLPYLAFGFTTGYVILPFFIFKCIDRLFESFCDNKST